jgi:hypothetical protein
MPRRFRGRQIHRWHVGARGAKAGFKSCFSTLCVDVKGNETASLGRSREPEYRLAC